MTRSAVIALALVLALGARGESDGTYVFERIATEHGLANANIAAALQDRQGYLWLATGGGLARFDGVHFTVFRPGNTPAFPTSLITCLTESQDGDLWIGTSAGLVRRHRNLFSFIGLKNATVSAIAEGRGGRLWIGTHERGLWSWDGSALRPLEARLPVPFVICLHVDDHGRLWIGYGGTGLGCWQDGRLSVELRNGELGDRVESIAAAPSGGLWLGTHNRGLFRWQGGALEHFGPQDGLTLTEISDIHVAGDGAVWVAGGAVERSADAEHPRFHTPGNLPSANVLRLAGDREGDIWLCAREEGLYRVHAFPFRTLSTETGLPENSVRTVSEGDDGELWMSLTRHGIARISPAGGVRLFGVKDGLPKEDAVTVLAAAGGSAWIGGTGPLCQWLGSAATTYSAIRDVRGVFRDSRGSMWFATDNQGLYRTTDGTFARVGPPGSLNHVTSFAEGPDGTLYVGMWFGGMARIDHGAVRVWNRAGGLPDDEVRALCVDREGHLWAGFRSRGLALWQAGRWWNPDAVSEEVANHVCALIDDSRGRLWMGTAAGLVWAWKSDLLAAAAGAGLPTMHFTGLSDGPRPVQVWSGPQPTAGALRDGRIAFASHQGVFIVDPAALSENPIAPTVVIERVTVDRTAREPGRMLDLPAGTRQLTIDYSAPSFIQPSRVLFKYQLEGYDGSRIDAGTARSATYGELPPGRYTFRVSACNNDGLWNETGAALEIVAEPHFYQTRAFYAAVAAAVLGLAFLGYQWSHRRLRLRLELMEQKHAMDRERERIAKILHDDLGADLTEIGLVAESARQSASLPQALNEFAELSERVRGLAGSLDTIVWAVNPANDSLDNLAGYLCDYFQGLFRRTPIRSRVEMEDDPPAWPLTPEARSNLFLAAKEAMNNVVRHSAATEVWLRLRMDGARLRLELADNGRGFDPAAPEHERRNGLANMRSRIAELGGAFQIDAAPGRGVTVIFLVPFPLHAHPPGHR